MRHFCWRISKISIFPFSPEVDGMRRTFIHLLYVHTYVHMYMYVCTQVWGSSLLCRYIHVYVNTFSWPSAKQVPAQLTQSGTRDRANEFWHFIHTLSFLLHIALISPQVWSILRQRFQSIKRAPWVIISPSLLIFSLFLVFTRRKIEPIYIWHSKCQWPVLRKRGLKKAQALADIKSDKCYWSFLCQFLLPKWNVTLSHWARQNQGCWMKEKKGNS